MLLQLGQLLLQGSETICLRSILQQGVNVAFELVKRRGKCFPPLHAVLAVIVGELLCTAKKFDCCAEFSDLLHLRRHRVMAVLQSSNVLFECRYARLGRPLLRVFFS